jgi:oxygen-independent coproporphyrinogen-3 oxidase
VIDPAAIPLSLYVHLPWCVRKCPYCDFNSHQKPTELPEAAYVDALLADWRLDAPLAAGRPLTSIFIGGGTPSLFSGAAIARLLDGVRAQVDLAPGCEITLECNPGTAEFDRFEGYLAAGVNRFSFGVQSFDDTMLKRLGRIHGGDEARRAVALARRAGVENLNIDLMHGLPGQDAAMARADLAAAIELEPEHLSCYQLTLEPGTVFARFPPQDLPDEDTLDAIVEVVEEATAAAGYERYEVSAYARPGRQSRHNLNYWAFGDYLAIGAGAHGKYTLAGGEIRRRERERVPSRWQGLAGSVGAYAERVVGMDDLPFEFMLNALRLRAGVPRRWLRERIGRDIVDLRGWRLGVERGLLLDAGETIVASDVGYRFLNDTVALFLHGAVVPHRS